MFYLCFRCLFGFILRVLVLGWFLGYIFCIVFKGILCVFTVFKVYLCFFILYGVFVVNLYFCFLGMYGC